MIWAMYAAVFYFSASLIYEAIDASLLLITSFKNVVPGEINFASDVVSSPSTFAGKKNKN
jgi:hypothetical protein